MTPVQRMNPEQIFRGVEEVFQLANSAFLIDIANSEAAVQADKIRELAIIGEENFDHVNG